MDSVLFCLDHRIVNIADDMGWRGVWRLVGMGNL